MPVLADLDVHVIDPLSVRLITAHARLARALAELRAAEREVRDALEMAAQDAVAA